MDASGASPFKFGAWAGIARHGEKLILSDIEAGLEKIIWTFGGGKGGCGKTFIAANLAISLAKEGSEVVLFDGGFGSANAHSALGIKPPTKTLSDFTRGDVADLADLLVPSPVKHLSLLPAAADFLTAANISYALKSKIIKRMKTLKCDHLLVDIGPGVNFNGVDLFLESDAGVIVITPEPAAIELAYRFIRAAVYRRLKASADRPLFEQIVDEYLESRKEGNLVAAVEGALEKIAKMDPAQAMRMERNLYGMDLYLVVNMARDHHDRYIGHSICEIVKKFYGLEMSYSGHIPYDDRATLSARRGRPFIREYEKSETTACFNLVLKDILGRVSEKMRAKVQQLNLINA
ncbi:MAG: P-loop NTPase [Nitrospinae bacterium]|nr:P-loop NTPase [Nitrospinota bacterium]